MPEDSRRRELHLAFDDMEVGVAHSTGRNPNQHLAGFGLRGWDLLHAQRCIDGGKNYGAHIAQFSAEAGNSYLRLGAQR